MLRSVAIKYHHVDGTKDNFPVPKADLEALYRSAGVDLRLLEGAPLAVDPAVSLRRNYAFLQRQYFETERDCGHLVIGLSQPDRRKDIAGQLHDLDWRGLAAVYVLSEHVQINRVDNFVQTIAHEIGHMLNLSHDDVSASFESTMNPLSKRAKAAAQCWADAGAEAQSLSGHGEDPLFLAPTVAPLCYPFALAARRFLNEASDARLLPWGGTFEHGADQINLCSCTRRHIARSALHRVPS